MKQKLLRIILNYKNHLYKLMNFFVDKKDNSFYFHIYRKHDETPMAPNGKSYQPVHEIYFPDYLPTGFTENKISIHETGIIHSTDEKGNRDHNGIRGIAFDDIKDFRVVLTVVPPDPAKLVTLQKRDTKRDIIINLNDFIEPFSLQFFIYNKKSTKKPHIPKKINLFNGIINYKFDDKNYGLMLAGIIIERNKEDQKVKWPPFILVLKTLR